MVVFKGPNGLRAGWRAAGFFVLSLALVLGIQTYVAWPIATRLHLSHTTINAPEQLESEFGILLAVMLATALCAWAEGRRVDEYGLPRNAAFGAKFWEGVAVGVVAAGAVAAGMYALGGFVIAGFGLQGAQWIVQPLLWAASAVLIGIAEEYWLRGYFLQSLARGIGFWPAAVVSTLLFGALHLFKNGENAVDIFNIMALGLFLCLTLQRTGNLWLAVGFHAAFDFMQFFAIGTQNGGASPVGTLFRATFPGPAWVNGGMLGTEASYFMFPVIAALYAYVLLRYPKSRLALPGRA